MWLRDFPEYLRVEGSPFEAGRIQGEALAPLIRYGFRLSRKYLFTLNVRNPTSRMRFLVRETQKRFPEEIEEWRGIARGADLDLYQVVLINRRLGQSVGCSAAAMTRSSQGPVAGANLDDNPIYYVKDSCISGQYRFLVMTFPGCLGTGDGINEHGLTILANSTSPVFTKMPPPPPFFTDTYNVFARVLRSCRTVEEAIELLRRPDIGGLGNHLVLDAQGQAACVEKKRHYLHQVRRPDEQGFLFSLNYFASEFNTPARMKKISPANRDRLTAVEKHRRKLTARNGLSIVRAIMSDTVVHDKKTNWPVSNAQTALGFLALPRARKAWFCSGPPHQARYQQFSFGAAPTQP